MLKILQGKPASVISVVSEASYGNIMKAISEKQLSDKHLRAVVNMCRTNPQTVICVIYKSFENSVLLLFGEKPVCIQVEGSKLESLMSNHSKDGHIYVFTYVK